jgi:hypothetical protein
MSPYPYAFWLLLAIVIVVFVVYACTDKSDTKSYMPGSKEFRYGYSRAWILLATGRASPSQICEEFLLEPYENDFHRGVRTALSDYVKGEKK